MSIQEARLWDTAPGGRRGSTNKYEDSQRLRIYPYDSFRPCDRQVYETDSSDNDSGPLRPRKARINLIRSRPFWILLSVFTLISFLLGIAVLANSDDEQKLTSVAATSSGQDENSSQDTPIETFGGKPGEGEPIRIGTLQAALLPGTRHQKSHHKSHRLVFVGDIHGCIDELMHLLTKLEYDESLDHIVTVGDMVNKGPSSHAVLDFLASQHASCVRGNHDDTILKRRLMASAPHEHVSISNDDPTQSLAMSLSHKQHAYLQSCPHILKAGKISTNEEIAVVHAGLVPSLRYEEQDPYAVMNMRIINKKTHVPSEKHELKGSVPWSDLWNKYQHKSTKDELSSSAQGRSQTTVIYGHDAKKGLQIKEYTKGLDSSCVKGGKLTALTIDQDGKHELFQVKCKDHT